MIKIRKPRKKLNEWYGAGFSDSNILGSSAGKSGQPYCEYRILPLSFNLQQKGNSSKEDFRDWPINIGQYVYGKCVYDKKEHHGRILNFYYEEGKNDLIKYIFILDQNREIVPLMPETVYVREDYLGDETNYMPYQRDPWAE